MSTKTVRLIGDGGGGYGSGGRGKNITDKFASYILKLNNTLYHHFSSHEWQSLKQTCTAVDSCLEFHQTGLTQLKVKDNFQLTCSSSGEASLASFCSWLSSSSSCSSSSSEDTCRLSCTIWTLMRKSRDLLILMFSIRFTWETSMAMLLVWKTSAVQAQGSFHFLFIFLSSDKFNTCKLECVLCVTSCTRYFEHRSLVHVWVLCIKSWARWFEHRSMFVCVWVLNDFSPSQWVWIRKLLQC